MTAVAVSTVLELPPCLGLMDLAEVLVELDYDDKESDRL